MWVKAQEDGRTDGRVDAWKGVDGWMKGRKNEAGWKEAWWMGGRVEGRGVDEAHHHGRGACRASKKPGEGASITGSEDTTVACDCSAGSHTFSSSCELVLLHTFGGRASFQEKRKKGRSGCRPTGRSCVTEAEAGVVWPEPRGLGRQEGFSPAPRARERFTPAAP